MDFKFQTHSINEAVNDVTQVIKTSTPLEHVPTYTIQSNYINLRKDILSLITM
jgi:hypothetical protein